MYVTLMKQHPNSERKGLQQVNTYPRPPPVMSATCGVQGFESGLTIRSLDEKQGLTLYCTFPDISLVADMATCECSDALATQDSLVWVGVCFKEGLEGYKGRR